MLLTELVLHNFGIYRGRHTVALAPPSADKPVILIGGLNGAGKTTFLDALQLVLYGPRARTSNRGQTAYEEYLRRCINRLVSAEDGSSLELSFRVERDGTTVTYKVKRQWSETGSRVREHLTVWCDGRRDDVLAENWSDHVEEIIPLEISSLFFFDGEKIEALADPTRARSVIRSAVNSLLGIGVVDRLSNDITALQRRQRPAERDEALEQKIAALEAAYERAQAARREVQDRLGHQRVLLGQAELHLDKAEAAFASGGGELLGRRKELEAEHAAATERVARLEEQLRTEAAGALPLTQVTRLLRELAEQAAAEASAASALQLTTLLEERDAAVLSAVALHLGPEEVATLESALLADRRGRRPSIDVPAYLYMSPDAQSELSALSRLLPELRSRSANLLTELEQAQEDLIMLDRRLAAVPAGEAVAQLAAEREAAREHLLELRGRCASVEEELERATRDRADAKAQLDKAVAQQIDRALRSEDTARLLEHSERARKTLEAYRAKLLTRHIGKLEVAVLDSFRRLMRKQGLVEDLRIDGETFELKLLGSDAQLLRPERLSAGERQLLAVAILWGLARLAGHRLPTVVDTPLGRLDSKHRRHLVERYFPQASRQVLLLSTDEEIDADLQRRLAESVGHSYLIEYDEELQSSTLAPGYFWGGLGHAA